MSKIDEVYRDLLKSTLTNGFKYEDPNRKGIQRTQISKYDFAYDMKEGFPLITTKKVYFKSVVGELLWFLRGDTHIKYLLDNGINIWNKDAFKYAQRRVGYPNDINTFIKEVKEGLKYDWLPLGSVGKIYGRQWRDFGGLKGERTNVDQISNLIKTLRENPMSTEHIVSAWNPQDKKDMALPPCHFGFQVMCIPLSTKERLGKDSSNNLLNKSEKEINDDLDKLRVPKYKFDLIWDQRSCDLFLGIPFNIASYALLMLIIGKLTNMIPNMLYGTLRNVHIYENALEAAWEQVYRDIKLYDSPNVKLSVDLSRYLSVGVTTGTIIDGLSIEDFVLSGYKHHPAISGVEMLERDE